MASRVIDQLIAGTEPARLLVFVDDAHLLDELSALVVHQLVQTELASVIVTIRSGEQTPGAVTALWKDGLIQRREVQPLSHGNTDELLAAAFGAPMDRACADRLWQLTDGNVLFLRQLVEQEYRAGRMAIRDAP